VELRLETAGDSGTPGGAEGLLSALSLEDAEALRAELGRSGTHVAEGAGHGEAIDAASLLEVIAYGVSVGRIGAAAVAIGLVMDALGQTSPEFVQDASETMDARTIAGVMLVAVAGGYALSVGNAIFRFYRHQWWRVGESLHIESGLLTRRRLDVPLAKVQLLRIQEPILRRWMGYATLFLETAAIGGLPGGGAVQGQIPMVDRDVLTDRARACLPTLDVDVEGRFAGCATRAVVRATVFGAVRWSILAGAAWVWLGIPWLWAMVPWSAAIAWLDATRQGWAVSQGFIVVRRGFLRRDTWLLPRNKMQSVRVVQGPLMRGYDLSRVVVWFPGGRLALPDLRSADARAVFEQLTRRSPASPPPGTSEMLTPEATG
jgi:putative membrane protein